MSQQFRIDVTVPRGDQQIHSAEAIVWAHQIELPVQCQIAEMDGPALADRTHELNAYETLRRRRPSKNT